MVDTRTRNNMNTASGPLTSESVSAVAHSDYRNGLMLDVDSITSIWQHPPQMPVVSVKQEPVAIEQGSHSPNNDSGISPGHGSSGSSAGRPSPGQSGSFGSPEHFSVQENRGMKSEPNTESDASSQLPSNQQPTSQNTAPVWGINLLQHSHSQCIVPSSLQAANNPNLGNSILKSASQTPMPEPEHPHQQQTKSPSSETHITENRTPSTSPLHSLNSLVIPMANRNHAVNQSMVSPNHCVQSPICDSPVRISSQNNMKTPPMHVKNATPGLNPGFSDDNNSRSSSTSSSTLTLDGGNENFKMTLHEGEQSPLRCLEMTVEQSSVMGGMRAGVASGPGVGNSGVRNVYQCPLCDYTTPSRTDFNDHNRTHCPDQKCSKCDFVTKDIAELEAHLCEHHMLSPGLAEQIIEANEEQPGIRVPRVNSQGKMKTFRCKQCSFVALTKMQFWNHSRCHIKREKMLNCPRCPFVTEYKHHLEYHLRNHANSKPFQCPDCSYSCVNKSMLNSHLKSHSNVCQYRCATCDYATKYLHSLKVHLRKYGHTPAMVLNPDGTPNPDPIIDVYGTRRGPKQRPRNIVKSSSKEKNNDASFPSHAPLSLSPFQPSYGVIPQQSGNLPIPYPYGCIMPNPFSANINSNSLLPKFPQSSSISIQDKSNTIPDSRRNSSNENYDHFLAASSEYYHMNNNTNNNNNNIVSNSNALKEIDTKKSIQKQNSIETSKLGTGEHALFLNNKTVDGDPLDLSKPDAMDICSEASVTYATPSILHKSASVKTSKHRRKGQAYKLDHISRKLQQQTSLSDIERTNRKYSHVPESEENPLSPEKTDNLTNTQPTQHENVHDNQHSESEMRKMKEELPRVEAQNRNSHENNTSSASKPEVYCCDHCDITFSDVILYSMHKGYHGYQDPFKCNMCGVQTANKVEFFLHIARSSHS